MVLPQSMRLKGHKCFDHIHRTGKRFNSSSMVLRVAKARPEILKNSSRSQPENSFRCAVAISSKVNKRAIARNRLRRIFHENLRQKFSNPNKNQLDWALISLKPQASQMEIIPLLKEFNELLFTAGLIS